MRLATMQNLRLPNHSVRLMADLLGEMRLDPDSAAVRANLQPETLRDPLGEISGAQEMAYQREFWQQTADRPDLWVELGRRYRILTHGHMALGLAMATAPDLRSMFRVSLEYDHLHYTLANTQVLELDGQLIGFRSMTKEVPQAIRQFTMVRDIASCNVVWRDFWGNEMPFRRIEMAIAPEYGKILQPFFGKARVEFNSVSNTWYWEPAFAQQPLPQSNALLHARYRQQCDQLVREASDAVDLVPRLEQLFCRVGWGLTLPKAAQLLELSSRTLQRRLSQRGISFRDIAVNARHRRACDLLLQTEASIASIAWDLGYQDIASFYRIFRSQQNMSPGQYRQQQMRLR